MALAWLQVKKKAKVAVTVLERCSRGCYGKGASRGAGSDRDGLVDGVGSMLVRRAACEGGCSRAWTSSLDNLHLLI